MFWLTLPSEDSSRVQILFIIMRGGKRRTHLKRVSTTKVHEIHKHLNYIKKGYISFKLTRRFQFADKEE